MMIFWVIIFQNVGYLVADTYDVSKYFTESLRLCFYV